MRIKYYHQRNVYCCIKDSYIGILYTADNTFSSSERSKLPRVFDSIDDRYLQYSVSVSMLKIITSVVLI